MLYSHTCGYIIEIGENVALLQILFFENDKTTLDTHSDFIILYYIYYYIYILKLSYDS